MENTPNYSPVCQNTAVLLLTGWLVKPFKPSCFCLLQYAIGHPQTLPEYHYEALFFSDGGIKKVILVKNGWMREQGRSPDPHRFLMHDLLVFLRKSLVIIYVPPECREKFIDKFTTELRLVVVSLNVCLAMKFKAFDKG